MREEEKARNNHVVKYLQQITFFLRHHNCQAYLVGGSARDLLRNEACVDWDIATDGDVVGNARQIAAKLGGHFVHMHDKANRIVVKDDLKNDLSEWIFDLSPIQGGSIEADLYARDFTLNALAIPLADVVAYLTQGTALVPIDPLNGMHDLAQQQLRMVHDEVFQIDPLRILRAVRFIYRYHLKLEERTELALRRDAPLVLEVASERIHDELSAILQPQGATDVLRFLDTHNILTTLIPELLPARDMPQPSLHHWDVFNHSLEAVTALEKLSTMLQQDTTEIADQSKLHAYSPYLNAGDLIELRQLLLEAQQQGIFQFADLETPTVKLGALLHDIGKTVTYTADEDGHITFYHHPQAGVPLAQQIMQRLHASTQERRLVQQIVAHHMRPGQLSHDPVTLRAIRRYFVDLGPTGIIVAIISLSDHLAMRGPEPLTEHWQRHLATVQQLLQSYIRERDSIIPPRLLQANELMRHLDLQPGPIVGQLLESIAEAQADKVVQSKEDALWFAEEQLKRIQQERNDQLC